MSEANHQAVAEITNQPFNEKNASLSELALVAQMFAASGMFKDAVDKAQAFTKMMVGRDLGIPMTRALVDVQMIQGKPTLSANLIAALIKRSGKYKYKVLKLTDDVCEIEFAEKIDGAWESCGPPVIFTMEHAKQAELTRNPTWKKFPRNMLFSRAISNGVKQYCGDVCLGSVYTPDELDPDVILDANGEVVGRVSSIPKLPKVAVKENKVQESPVGSGPEPLSSPAVTGAEDTLDSLARDVEDLAKVTGFDLDRFLKESKVKSLKSLDAGGLKNVKRTLALKLETQKVS